MPQLPAIRDFPEADRAIGPPEARTRLSGEKAKGRLWPSAAFSPNALIRRGSPPRVVSHKRRLPSLSHANVLPFGVKTKRSIRLEGSRTRRFSSPTDTSKRRRMPSSFATASNLPSGEKAREWSISKRSCRSVVSILPTRPQFAAGGSVPEPGRTLSTEVHGQ